MESLTPGGALRVLGSLWDASRTSVAEADTASSRVRPRAEEPQMLSMRTRWSQFVLLLGLSLLGPGVCAQHEEPPAAHPATKAPPKTAPNAALNATPSATEQKRGSPEAPTHAPHIHLPPQLAFAFVRAGHDAWQEATRKRLPPPTPAERPSGAGRYVCAVVVCADLDREVAPLLGLRREDVLVLSTPGPFVTPEIAASLERQVKEQRLPLILVLSHDRCPTLAKPAQGGPRDVLSARRDLAAKDAERRQLPVEKALALAQRELLLASSERLAAHVDDNTLRVMSAQVETETGAITWFSRPIDELPMPPVK